MRARSPAWTRFPSFVLCMALAIAASIGPDLCAEETASVEQLTETVAQSLVVFESTGREGQRHGEGSGFAVAEDLIVTARHVIGEGRPVFVTLPDKRSVRVTHVYAQAGHVDVAVVKTEKHGLPVLQLNDESPPSAGQDVIAMGHPFGLRNSVVKGVISGRRDIDGISMLQLDMTIEPGNSGGPVVDRQGRVLGIVTLKSTETDNIGFAVPVEHLRQLLDSPNPVPMDRWVRIGALDPKRWKIIGGAQWKQRAGRISVDGIGTGFGGRTLCILNELPEFPVEIEVDVRLDDEEGAAGLVIHSDGDQKHYGFYPSAGNLRFTRFNGPDVNQWTILHNQPEPSYAPGEWNVLRVRIEGDRMECFVNGQHVLTTHNDSLDPGQLGFASFRGTQAEFRNLTIATSIEDSRPSAEQRAEIESILEGADAKRTSTDEPVEQLVPFGPRTPHILRTRAVQLENQANDIRRLADDVHTALVRDRLRTSLQLHEQTDAGEQPDLLMSALLLAQLDNEEVRPDDYVARVDSMVTEIEESLPADASESSRLKAIDRWMFEENGYRGSNQDYYTRSNSYLNEVIDDREGLPVTLSVLYIELARRLNLDVAGIGLPGHYIVRFDPSESESKSEWIDVFDRGTRLTEDEVDQIIRIGGNSRFEEFKAPQSPRQIIERMLRNLLALAEQARDDRRVLRYLEVLVSVSDDNIEYRAKRLEIRARTGNLPGAISDADWFLKHKPAQIDVNRLQQLKDRLESQLELK